RSSGGSPADRLLLGGCRRSFGETPFRLGWRDDEVLVCAVSSPRTRRDVAHFDKVPSLYVGPREPEIITDGRRNIQACPMVEVRLRPLILENILKMIGAKRATIFPLRVAGAVAFSNCDPAIFAH